MRRVARLHGRRREPEAARCVVYCSRLGRGGPSLAASPSPERCRCPSWLEPGLRCGAEHGPTDPVAGSLYEVLVPQVVAALQVCAIATRAGHLISGIASVAAAAPTIAIPRPPTPRTHCSTCIHHRRDMSQTVAASSQAGRAASRATPSPTSRRAMLGALVAAQVSLAVQPALAYGELEPGARALPPRRPAGLVATKNREAENALRASTIHSHPSQAAATLCGRSMLVSTHRACSSTHQPGAGLLEGSGASSGGVRIGGDQQLPLAQLSHVHCPHPS